MVRPDGGMRIGMLRVMAVSANGLPSKALQVARPFPKSQCSWLRKE